MPPASPFSSTPLLTALTGPPPATNSRPRSLPTPTTTATPPSRLLLPASATRLRSLSLLTPASIWRGASPSPPVPPATPLPDWRSTTSLSLPISQEWFPNPNPNRCRSMRWSSTARLSLSRISTRWEVPHSTLLPTPRPE